MVREYGEAKIAELSTLYHHTRPWKEHELLVLRSQLRAILGV